MTEILEHRAPRVRCYECGSESVFSVCHHCQRPMCEQHSPLVFRHGGARVPALGGAIDEARPISKELAGLRLGGLREAVYHCKDHEHLVRGFPLPWIAAGAGSFALGFLLLFASVATGLVLMLIGAALTGGALLTHRMLAERNTRPPLPLVPQVNAVDMLEQLTGYVRLEHGEYTSTVDSLDGEMKVNLSANDGHLVLRAYRKKFAVPEPEPVPFSAGYLMVRGDVGLAFRAGQVPVLPGGTGIVLGGDSADTHELFPDDPELPQRESNLAIGYEVQDDRSPREIPLWIVPSLVPSSDRRSLEIDLHWNDLGADGQRLRLAMFDLVALEVPASWGSVESFAPSRVEIGQSAGRRIIRWKQLKPDVKGAQSLTLKLRFERPITEVSESAGPAAGDFTGPDDGTRTRLTLAGTLEATFNGLLSGAKGVGVFLPGGGTGHPPPTTTRTKVAVGFDVSLRSIRYQDERVVPDEHDEDDIRHGRHRVDEFHGIVPDHRIVAELTNAISADGYYVKSVVEHQPYRDDGRPGVVNRVWDISGRLYVGLFPMDFDISLRGDEIATAGGFSGMTVAQVTVKGAYARGTLVDRRSSFEDTGSPADLSSATIEADRQGDELLRRIEDTWTGLHDRVTQVLSARAGRAGGPRSLPGPAEHVVHGEVIEPDASRLPDDVVTVDAVMVPAQREAAVESVPPPPSNGFAGRLAELRRQREAADDAVIMGRISDGTYGRIVARIEAELNELGASS
ncbi:hypothetical protein GCM10010399_76640 [Dactylosporangium fulvum]|uniref:DUF4429 domain-containing protein n=1 Tax=Dactylosporangium fulvum TaxID=53359 RepID=A0ABY5W7S1_9ACTN|nr:hypothetical protein [Dactylosporangium fulvum]UWP85141.1 hypothetical protein Dfulv_13285 [Dactylosporangium fulvum]